jgi:hypothetical protein
VRLGAHGCRSVHESILGPDLAAKRRGGAGRGGATRTVTGEGAGVRILPGSIVRATCKTNWCKNVNLTPCQQTQGLLGLGVARAGANGCGEQGSRGRAQTRTGACESRWRGVH